MILKEPKYL
jgi:hypothetical protein